MRSRTRVRVLAAAAGVPILAALAWIAADHLLPESSPMQRGAARAEDLGCWSCHVLEAHSEGEADGGAAPSMFGGSREPAEIAYLIRKTPAHERRISDAAISDLVAWIAVIQYESDRVRNPAPERGELAEAERLARRECFLCHGELGQGGLLNPGSLKGYVPGFFGRDFDLLTRDGDEGVVREWLVDGLPEFFYRGVGGQIALWFSERQQVKMPAYDQTLSPEQIETLRRYMKLLRRLGPLDGEAVARYRARVDSGGPLPR